MNRASKMRQRWRDRSQLCLNERIYTAILRTADQRRPQYTVAA